MNTYFVEKLRQNAEKYPDRVALALDFDEERVSCSELWEQSGRIYAALREKGIGREDFVMLLLPRSPKMFVAMLGVLRAGAAFIFMEDSYPRERIRLIHENCQVRFTLDLRAYEEAMRLPSLPGYEKTDPHDACCSFSTSGTTGTPKSMVHEYGKLDVCLDSWYADVEDLQEEDPPRFGMIFPFNFAAAFVLPLPKLYAAHPIYIMSYDTVKNLVRFEDFLEAEHITEMYLSPSFIRNFNGSYHHIRKIIAAGEPATGVYVDGIDIYAYYGMSETCFMVSSYLLDKACERAVIGKNNFGLRIRILDEDGNDVPQGESGEICYDNPYFRCYLHLTELNEEVWKYGIFHSKDLGYFDENGNLVIRGRLDDMVKINGNRVEPMEIELTARQVFGIEHTVAKAFSEESRSFVVLYYLKAEEIPVLKDPQEAGRLLSARLPSYMIPTYYVGMDAFPTNENGKTSRKMLPKPDIRSFRNIGAGPANAAERVFCKAMAVVLGLAEVGTQEDFFLIGGDSLTAIQMLTACAKEGYYITVNGLYACRTAEKLAQRFGADKMDSGETLRQENAAAIKKPQALLAGQKFQMEMAVRQKAPGIITYHVAMVFGLRPEVDIAKLKLAAEKVLRHHPAFLSGFLRDENGEIRQYYDEDLFAPVETVSMTDEEFARKKPVLTSPMDPFGGRLYRCQIIETPSGNYFFYDFHHLIADEMSASLFLRQVAVCYFDGNAVLPADPLYRIMAAEEAVENEEYAREISAFSEAVRQKQNFPGKGIFKQDLSGPETGTGIFQIPNAFVRSAKCTNRLFLTACAMAVAEMNGEGGAVVYSNYHGRDDWLKNDSVNCYVTPVPIVLDCRPGRRAKDMLQDVREQFDFGAAHCASPFILDNRDVLGNTVMFNYRDGTMDLGNFAKLIREVYLCPKPIDQPNCLVIAGVTGLPGSDALGFYCTYPAGLYSEDQIRRFYQHFASAVEKLAEEANI